MRCFPFSHLEKGEHLITLHDFFVQISFLNGKSIGISKSVIVLSGCYLIEQVSMSSQPESYSKTSVTDIEILCQFCIVNQVYKSQLAAITTSFSDILQGRRTVMVKKAPSLSTRHPIKMLTKVVSVSKHGKRCCAYLLCDKSCKGIRIGTTN